VTLYVLLLVITVHYKLLQAIKPNPIVSTC